jgi:hypothetical protein
MIFPRAYHEAIVQELDQTRIVATKSFANAGSHIIATSIRPRPDLDRIFVVPDVKGEVYLDWAFDFLFYIDETNNKLDFDEGGSALVGTLTTGLYTLAELASEAAVAMTAAAGSTGTYEAEVSDDDEVTLESDVAFSLLLDGDNWETSCLGLLGFMEDPYEMAALYSNKTSHEGLRVESARTRMTVACDDVRKDAASTGASANLTVTAHGWSNGDTVTVLGPLLPAIFTEGATYFVVNKATNTVQLSLTEGGAALTPVTTAEFEISRRYERDFYIQVASEKNDNLFSGDPQLIQHEPDIMGYVADGRASFLDYHRRAQGVILDRLGADGVHSVFGRKLTKHAVMDIQEVQEWSTFIALGLIFHGLQDKVDDINAEKAEHYDGRATTAMNRFKVRLDRDGDKKISPVEVDEAKDLATGQLVRR